MIRPIDANALKQYMGIEDAAKYGNETEEKRHNSYATLMNYEIADCIDDMPTLDYAPVRYAYWVPWIEDVEIYNTGGFVEQKQVGWKCSGCKNGRVSWKRTYCPDCGAKMDGDSNNGV